MASLNAQFCSASSSYLEGGSHSELDAVLESTAKDLASSLSLREGTGSAEPTVWKSLAELWEDAARRSSSSEEDSGLAHHILVLAKFTRNLVAGCAYNQTQAFSDEPLIRKIVHRYTSFSAIQEDSALKLTRMLPRTLSNMITGNEALITQFWDTQLKLSPEQAILPRLLSVPDPGTSLSVLVLLINCIHGSKKRTASLVSTKAGTRLAITIFDRIAALSIDDAPQASRAFELGYTLFTRIAEQDIKIELYRSMAVQDEVTTPHQTTLLRLLDSYLQSSDNANPATLYPELVPHLIEEFLALSAYAQAAIRQSMGSSNQPPSSAQSSTPTEATLAQAPDVLLPKVCEALVLVTQCLTTVCLHLEQDKLPKPVVQELRVHIDLVPSGGGLGLVESLVAVLQLVTEFLPRMMFGKVVTPGQGGASGAAPNGFPFLKRDLVRLLGILAYRARNVQDRVRACGGIEAVMNMTVIDDQNPYLREHAIFALRNILEGNAENQALVAELKPMGTWDENGVLVDTPGAVRR